MRVFLLPDSFNGERQLQLQNKQYHYLIRVLRLKEGSQFVGRDASGKLWDLLLNSIDTNHHSCTISCTETTSVVQQGENALPPQSELPEIHLYQSLLKGKKFDTLIRQTVEIGVTRIIPLQSEYSVPDLLSKDSKKKISRWQTIRDEALQQCGSPVRTEIASPIPFASLQSDWGDRGLLIFLHQEELISKSLKVSIEEFASRSEKRFPIALVIGPEGGLSDSEIVQLKKAGFTPAFLKTNILRAETAALYAVSCTQMVLSEIFSL